MDIEKIIEQIKLIILIENNETNQKILITKFIEDFNNKYTINEKNKDTLINLKNSKINFKPKKITRTEYEDGKYHSCKKCIYYKNFESYALSDMKYCSKDKDSDELLSKNFHTFSIYDHFYKLVEVYECDNYSDDIIDINDYNFEDEILNIDDLVKD